MKHMSQKNNRTFTRPPVRWLIIFLVAGVLVAGAAYAWSSRNTNDAKTTSTSGTAQDDYSDGRPRDTNGQGTGNSQGGAKDTNGQAPTTPGAGSTASQNGAVTVLGLVANDVLESNDVLQGTAKAGISQVQFRIIDDEVGVVAQGHLNVVEGKFSGTLSFAPKSNTGRIDIFTFDATGTEENSIEIPVRFK